MIQALTGAAYFQGSLGKLASAALPEMTQDAVFDKSTAYTVKDAITAALFARDAGTAGTTNGDRGQTQQRDGQCIEISLLEAGSNR